MALDEAVQELRLGAKLEKSQFLPISNFLKMAKTFKFEFHSLESLATATFDSLGPKMYKSLYNSGTAPLFKNPRIGCLRLADTFRLKKFPRKSVHRAARNRLETFALESLLV